MSGMCMEAFGKNFEALRIMFCSCWSKVGVVFCLLLSPMLSITTFGVVCGGRDGHKRFSKCLMFAPGKQCNSIDLTLSSNVVAFLILLSPKITVWDWRGGILHLALSLWVVIWGPVAFGVFCGISIFLRFGRGFDGDESGLDGMSGLAGISSTRGEYLLCVATDGGIRLVDGVAGSWVGLLVFPGCVSILNLLRSSVSMLNLLRSLASARAKPFVVEMLITVSTRP